MLSSLHAGYAGHARGAFGSPRNSGCLMSGQVGKVFGHHPTSKSHVNVRGPGGQTTYYEFQHLTKKEPVKDYSPLAQLEDNSRSWMGLVFPIRPTAAGWKPVSVSLTLDSTENGASVANFTDSRNEHTAFGSPLSTTPKFASGGLVDRRLKFATDLPSLK